LINSFDDDQFFPEHLISLLILFLFINMPAVPSVSAIITYSLRSGFTVVPTKTCGQHNFPDRNDNKSGTEGVFQYCALVFVLYLFVISVHRLLDILF
jgi:hypothetical protein